MDFDKPLPIMDRSFKQKINKDTLDLNNKLHQMELTDIHRTFYPLAAEYIFFSSVHGTFFRIDHMLGHKTSLNKFKKTEIIPSIFSNFNVTKLEINIRGKPENSQICGD